MRTGALFIFGILMLNAVSGFGVVTAQAAGNTTSAVEDFGSCLASQQTGDLLLLVDESSSLQISDPDAARVSAANFLLDRLTAFGESAAVDLNVAIAGFSSDYTVHTGWTSLDSGTLPTLKSSVDEFRSRTNGIDTDYWGAMDGARSDLGDRPQNADGSRRCQAIAWFSDGKLDFTERDGSKPYAPGATLGSPDGVKAVVAAATESICRPAGIADQIRSAGIKTFGIGLAAGTAVADDFDLMRAITSGTSGDGTQCGAVQSPPPGEFFLAQNIDDLLFAFDSISTPGQAPLERESGVCVRDVCEEGKHRFVLDSSISAVNVLGFADAPGLIPTLIAPNGEQLALPLTAVGTDSRGQLGGVEINYRWESPNSVSFSMTDAGSPQWQGVWALAFVDPTGSAAQARSKSNIHISGNLFPAWLGQKTAAVHTGEKTSAIELGIVGADRAPIDPETLLGTAELSVSIVDSTGTVHDVAAPLPKDRIGESVELDLTDVPPGDSTLRLTLNVTTANATRADGGVEPGTALTPQSVDIALPVAPPIGFPSLPARVDFGTLEGSGRFDRTLDVTGAGCVRLDAGNPVSIKGSPDGIGSVVLTTSGDAQCLDSTGTLPVSIDIENAANGTVSGTMSLLVSPEGESDREVSVPVEFTADVQKQVDTGRFWLTLIVALILGPGIPLLLLYLGKWLTAKIPAGGLKAKQFPIEIRNGEILREGRPFELRDRDLVESVRGMHEATRVLDADGVELRTHVGLSPVGAGYVTASLPGLLGASGSTPATDKAGNARLPLAVHNSWAVFHDPNGPAEFATLLLLISADADENRVARVLDDARRNAANAVSQVRAASVATSGAGGVSGGPNSPGGQQGSSAADPFGGPPGGAASGGFQPASGHPGESTWAPPAAGGGNADPFAPPSGFDPFGPPDGRGR
ncbi:vWA domain-containing protein [Rhodococcus sp. OK302]|uniref:vWA domain-containing protein n=1 Tax=Rhodococcus sp. OK302 TaxID=1882769 RepID=UPI000B941FC2|nr:vWA domain-containing protein [Rhodococcus sp. OK302]OYD71419.1 hypothetical protein BDB13_5091 [Rhodococcus sp. OK302]